MSSLDIVDISQLRALFTKPYGAPAPTEQQWRQAYSDDVVFEDPTQKQKGLNAYLAAQEGLLRRCDDVVLRPGAIAMDGNTAFVEWEMGLKIKGIEFIYHTPAVQRRWADRGSPRLFRFRGSHVCARAGDRWLRALAVQALCGLRPAEQTQKSPAKAGLLKFH